MNTPYYLIDEAALRRNLEILRGVRERTGCKILLAQKAFSMFAVYPIIAEYLDGATASGLFEARLAAEELQGENHVFSAAYRAEDIPELARLCDHVVFNSCAQLRAYAPQVLAAGKHFHTLCEQDSDALETTLDAVEARFGEFFPGLRWLNFGGGHHITRPGYDIPRLERCIDRIQQRYGLQVYLEPGEAVALNAGVLRCTVLDIVENGGKIAILDTSAACHMPDVLEMPYRPPLRGSGLPGEKAYSYRLGGPTCLAGDIIGDYSFDRPLAVGDVLEFGDMAIYSMVKNNTFNGMPLPSIALRTLDGTERCIRSFGYEDFKQRLS